MTKWVGTVILMVSAAQDEADPVLRNELLQSAIDKLQNVRKKTDGCSTSIPPTPDNDWIDNCDTQAILTPLIDDAIASINDLI